MQDQLNVTKVRSLLLRLIFASVWFVAIYLVVEISIGAVVGVFGSTHGDNEEMAYAAAEVAIEAFFDRYLFAVLIGVFGFVFALSWYEILPGTNKLRAPESTIGRRWIAVPSWFRYLLAMLIVLIASGVWGAMSVLFYVPMAVTSLGVIVISLGVFIGLTRKDK